MYTAISVLEMSVGYSDALPREVKPTTEFDFHEGPGGWDTAYGNQVRENRTQSHLGTDGWSKGCQDKPHSVRLGDD